MPHHPIQFLDLNYLMWRKKIKLKRYNWVKSTRVTKWSIFKNNNNNNNNDLIKCNQRPQLAVFWAKPSYRHNIVPPMTSPKDLSCRLTLVTGGYFLTPSNFNSFWTVTIVVFQIFYFTRWKPTKPNGLNVIPNKCKHIGLFKLPQSVRVPIHGTAFSNLQP